MNDLVSIKEPINRALDNMAMDEIDAVPIMIDWAIECDRDRIGSYYNYEERIHVLDVNECKAKLPCGTEVIVGVLLGDCGCDCGLFFNVGLSKHKSGKITSLDEGLIVIDASSGPTVTTSGLRYTIQNNHLVFEANLDEQKVTVKTLGYKLDNNGFPMINRNHIPAISSFLEWKVAKRNRWKPKAVKFSASELREMERIWEDECADARAKDNLETPSSRDEIALLINDPLTGYYQGVDLRHPDDYDGGHFYGEPNLV